MGAYRTGTNDTQANNGGTNSGYDNSILSVQDSLLRFRLHVGSSGRALGAAPYPRLLSEG